MIQYLSKLSRSPLLTLRFKGIGKVNTYCISDKWAEFVRPLFLRTNFRRCFIISNKELSLNEQIRAKEVRLVDTDGSQLGIVSISDALAKAADAGVDLVEIAPQAQPPVCKIMDYGKYKFELAKRDKEAKKNQKVVSIKEIRVSPSIDVHDFETKVNHIKKFLKSGDKVKITVRFRGREMHHTSLGKDLLDKFAESIAENGNIEKNPKLEGRNMFMVVSPK